MTTITDAIKNFPKRSPDAHKGDLGHVLVIAGSSGYTGAAYLTSQAAGLSGSGLVTLAIGRSLYQIMASKLTEVIVRPYFETKDFSLSLLAERDMLSLSEKCTAVAMGPGLSKNRETQHLVRNLIAKIDRPVVLDADGINSFIGHVNTLKSAKNKLVLTPHPGEFSALTGIDKADIDKNRKDVAQKFANEYNVVLVLKGNRTVVADPAGDVYVNETGNAGMATGGTGDVLTGMIAAFIGQGLTPFNAAVLGSHFHGMAGDIAVREKGVLSLIATDLLHALPQALKQLG